MSTEIKGSLDSVFPQYTIHLYLSTSNKELVPINQLDLPGLETHQAF